MYKREKEVIFLQRNIIYNEDCIIGMSKTPDNSVDFILTDPPYGVTKCTWDKVLPPERMWEQYYRVAKNNAAIVLFSDEPFSTQLINSNTKHFRYKWIWNKKRGSNFQNKPRHHACLCSVLCCLLHNNPDFFTAFIDTA